MRRFSARPFPATSPVLPLGSIRPRPAAAVPPSRRTPRSWPHLRGVLGLLPALLAFLAFLPGTGVAGGPTFVSPEQDPLVRNLDPSVKPGDDFFLYATGTWIKQNPIPPSERSWSIAKLVQEEIYSQLHEICLASAAINAPAGSADQKIGDFWTAAMDSVGIEAQGIAPLRPEFARIDAIQSRNDLLEAIARLHTYGVHPFYGLYIGQDDKNSSAYVVFLYQSGLGLPDRDYYFRDDPATAHIREEYPKHLTAMFRLLGDDEAKAAGATESVLSIERALARSSRTLEALRDPYANYNKMSMDQLNHLTSAVDWKEQFRLMGLPSVDSVVVGQPEFCSTGDSTLAQAPLSAWKDYLRWCLINTFAERLSTPFDQQDFHFYGTIMGGAQVQRARWKRVLDAEEDGIGELLGQIWVRKYCSPATKARYEKLVDNTFEAYRERMEKLPWMSPETKEKAEAKLDKVVKKVGYPDHWRDYSALSLDRTSYVQNQMRVNEWWFRYQAGKLGRPVDRTEWDMTPQTYNAYYNGSNVEIVLPAAAFFIPDLPDSLMDDAILYSYAGASTIGHEITHGFDDQGRQYDDQGNMKPWWTVEDSVRFTERAQLLVDQFDQYTLNGKHIRGQATLGENIADLGGVVIGYDAFKKTDQWKKGEKINGLTPDQRFFLGYALAWLGSQRPQSLDQQIMTDVHAPRMFRVNGPLANIPEFYAAFGIKPGDPMYRDEKVRVTIW